MRFAAATMVATTVLAAAATCRAGQTVIDDFESAASPSPWVFSNGPEFPGAGGYLSSAPGATGKGAALGYDFHNGGHYVRMTLSPPTPITATAIGFSVKAVGVQVSFGVIEQARASISLL